MVLLEINIGIAGISFVMLVVVHSSYSDKVKELKKKTTNTLDAEALNLRKELGEQWTPESRKKLSELLAKYREAGQPREWLNQATVLFLYSGLAAALGILCNLSTVVPSLASANVLEGPFAFFAVVFLLWAAYHTYNVIKLISNGEDPELPSIPMIAVVAVLQFADAVFLYIFYSQFFITHFLSLKFFIVTLVASILIGFVLILRWKADISMAEKLVEIGTIASPWIVLAIVILLNASHIPLF
jgi:hypothetical protein